MWCVNLNCTWSWSWGAVVSVTVWRLLHSTKLKCHAAFPLDNLPKHIPNIFTATWRNDWPSAIDFTWSNIDKFHIFLLVVAIIFFYPRFPSRFVNEWTTQFALFGFPSSTIDLCVCFSFVFFLFYFVCL